MREIYYRLMFLWRNSLVNNNVMKSNLSLIIIWIIFYICFSHVRISNTLRFTLRFHRFLHCLNFFLFRRYYFIREVILVCCSSEYILLILLRFSSVRSFTSANFFQNISCFLYSDATFFYISIDFFPHGTRVWLFSRKVRIFFAVRPGFIVLKCP